MRKFRCWFLCLWKNFREFKKSHGLKIPGCSAGVGGTSVHCEGSTTLPASHGLLVHRFNSENSLFQKYVSFSHEKSSALLVEKVLFFLSVLLIGFSTWDHFSSAFPKNQCSCSPQRFASFIRFRSKVLWVEFWSTGKGDCCCTCWTDIFYIIALE